jgi:DNA repair protein RadC
VICWCEVSRGYLNGAPADPCEVFRAALRSHAASIILAHNHPSGDPDASAADLLATRRLIGAGRIVGVSVLDHIIIGGGTFVSLRPPTSAACSANVNLERLTYRRSTFYGCL